MHLIPYSLFPIPYSLFLIPYTYTFIPTSQSSANQKLVPVSPDKLKLQNEFIVDKLVSQVADELARAIADIV